MERILLLEKIILFFLSIILIYFSSRVYSGTKRSLCLISAWIISSILSLAIITEIFSQGLDPEEIILSIYSFAILFGLVIHLLVNIKSRKEINPSKLYPIKPELNSELRRVG